MKAQELEINNTPESFNDAGSNLFNMVFDNIKSFDFNTKTAAVPQGFPSVEDLLGGQTNGIKEDTLEFARGEAADGGQLGSKDYAAALTKDLGSPKFKEALNNLDHDSAMKSLEELREQNSTGRLLESDLRQAYAGASTEQRVAILYALTNFETFAKAGNTFGEDWSWSGKALDKEDLSSAVEPNK